MRRKRFFVWLCACLFLVPSPARAAGVPAGFQRLVMTNLQASIAYPAAWRPVWSKGREFLYGPVARNFTTNVNIYFVTHPQASSLADFGSAIKAADTKAGASIGRTYPLKVGGIPALSIRGRLSQTLHGKVVQDRFTIAAFLVRGQGWQITLSASPSVYWANMKLFRKMLRTFALTA
jgi:hypothetical protein